MQLDTGDIMFNSLTFSGLCRIFFASLMAISVSTFAKDDLIWNTLDPENTVYLQMQEGTVVIELNPAFAPKTVKRFKELLAEQFYRGMSFYRVIDGFVAQGGDESDIDGSQVTKTLKAEFEINWPLKPKDKEKAKGLIQTQIPRISPDRRRRGQDTKKTNGLFTAPATRIVGQEGAKDAKGKDREI